MPKEFIDCADYGRTVPVVSAEGEPIEYRQMDMKAVKVGWARGRRGVEMAVLECPQGVPDEYGFTDDGEPTGRAIPQYLELDRGGINKLIRTLRKARDQAFGADA